MNLNRAATVSAIAGDHVDIGERVRSLRKGCNMSVRALAARAGFSPSFISQMENGVVSPSITSLEQIASALGITLAAFFTGQRLDAAVISYAGRRREAPSSWSQSRIEATAPPDMAGRLEAVMITMASGGRSGHQASIHPGDEFAIVFDGKVTLTLGTDVYVLQPGDTASFSSETPHLWENQGPGDARVVIVSPRFTH